MKALSVFPVLFPLTVLLALLPLTGGEEQDNRRDEARNDKAFQLGVADNYMRWERYRTIDQVNTFIPPFYQPAFVGHGYVLPPGAWRVGLGSSFLDIGTTDFFKNGDEDLVHENHTVSRVRANLKIFRGFDYNMTLFVDVPFWTSRSLGSVHPAGVQTMDLFVEGNSQKLGDITVILKKKWRDQGNFAFNLATVTGLKLPTGANDETFDQPMDVRMPNGQLGVAFGGGPFPRFTDDGRLPSVLQPGTGGWGALLGVMGTRQYPNRRMALHAGTLYSYLEGKDGVEPGNEWRFFVSLVKPVYKDILSLDMALNGMNKQNDSYVGMFTHPYPNSDGSLAGLTTTPRPSFRGGTVGFFSPSLILTPQPQVRFTLTASFRLNNPDLGPWPGHILQLGMGYTF